MRIALLINSKAGSAGAADEVRTALSELRGATVFESDSSLDLRTQIREALSQKVDLLAVAGGDGTIHGAVNALGPDFPPVPVLVIPLGTGNDLCRTLAIPLDPVQAVGLLRRHHTRKIDVVRVAGDWSGFLVNVATGGFSGKVAAEVTSDTKAAWGPLAYLRGAAGPIADPPTFRVTVRFDHHHPQNFEILNLVVANARTAAGGYVVAPRADPEDGKLDIVLVRSVGSTLDMSVIAARLLAGNYVADENVVHRRARRVEITSEDPIPMSLDGELVEGRRFEFETIHQPLRMLVGPGYRRMPRLGWVGNTRFGDVGRRIFTVLAGVLHVARRIGLPGVVSIALAIACLGGFAYLAHGVTAGEWNDWNLAVRADVRSAANPDLTRFAEVLTTLGGGAGNLLGAVIALVLVLRRQFASASMLLFAMLGSTAIEYVGKAWFAVERPEPTETLTAIGAYSFPSGHTIRAVALAGILAVILAFRCTGWWRWPAVLGLAILAGGVGWTRIYLGMHWPTDVLASALLGTAWFALTFAIFSALRRKNPPRPRSPRLRKGCP